MDLPNSPPSSDEFAASQRADQFIQALHDHRGQVFGFIFSMVQRIADAEDVYQETCIALWNMFDAFEPGSDFAAWACGVARFKALTYLQKHRRERHCFSNALLDQLTEQAAARPDLATARLAALQHCRERLPPADAELIEACYHSEITIKQAAERLGRPVGGVYDSLTRIRRVLFACIQRRLAREGLA